ncbi:hypothetical protein IJJ12_02810 [bacterium]|nr:hypothetical protein [bacterium]
MCRIGVCSGPLAAQAATIPTGYLEFGKYIKASDYNYINATSLSCPSGSEYCGDNTFYDADRQTCDILTLQNFTSIMCDAFTTPTGTNYIHIGYLMDERDHQFYAVRKYADGHCWLAENLKFGHNCHATTFTTSDTSTAGYVGTYNGYAYRGLCRSPGVNFDGYLYNWEAAMNNNTALFTGTYNNRTNGTTLATHDICPLGWHIPTGGNFGEWHLLAQAIAGQTFADGCSAATCSDAYNFFRTANTNSWNATTYSTLAGVAIDGTLMYQGTSSAVWWSSTPSASSGMTYIFDAPEALYVTRHYYRYAGLSVRCLADY